MGNAESSRERLCIPPFQGVFLDYDGVTADTMPPNLNAWAMAFQDFGVKITKDDYYALEGMSPQAIAEKLGKQFNLPPNAYEQIPAKKAAYYRVHAGPLIIYPGVEDLLRLLKAKGKNTGLVSGATRERITEITPKKLLELFDVVVTATDLARSKPYPDPYETAMLSLGIQASQVIVIENAPLGVESAKAAGAFCVALTTTVDSGRLAQADMILPGISELLALLKHDMP